MVFIIKRSLSCQRRWNPLGIQMLSKSLYEQIFGQDQETYLEESINNSITHLTKHSLWGKQTQTQPDITVKLPPLSAKDISSHFIKLADTQLEPYHHLINSLIKCTLLPSTPTRWNYQAGWTRYSKNGDHTLVPFPDEPALLFDIEVCVKEGPSPILATAASPNFWYSWVSERLVDEQDYLQRSKVKLEDLIPFGGEAERKERLIVGHSVSYDRAGIREEYLINGPETRFLDTLSLHVCVAGQTTAQKVLWRSIYGRKDETDKEEEDENNEWAGRDVRTPSKWMRVSSANGLADVCQLYCGERIDKTKRNVFVNGTIADVRNDFQQLMSYCSDDVTNTHKVLLQVYPLFLTHCPNPVTLAGMLEMSSMYLPVGESWNKFIQSARYTAEDMELEMSTKLVSLANDACTFSHEDRYTKDVWLSNLDWSVKKLRSKRKTKKEMKYLLEALRGSPTYEEGSKLLISTPLPPAKRRVHKPGYPEWYRQLCVNINESPWQPGPVLISSSMRVTPYLLRIKWADHPLHYHPSLAWGYIVPVGLRKEQRVIWNLGEQENLHLSASQKEEELRRTSPTEGLEYQKEVLTVSFGCGQLEAEVEPRKRHRVETEFGLTDDVIILGGDQYYYFKLPHKDGVDANCGNPLSKDYLSKMQSGILTSALGSDGQRILELSAMGSYWKSNQKRIDNQVVVWSNDKGCGSSQGVIIPITKVAGTVTRRAVESTWMTASNAKENMLGSELKAMIQSPPGYCIVGADVDSQEVWIASLLGDRHFSGIQGGTGFSWMTLQGIKSEGTDIHSMTARTIGTSREQAKAFNYGRLYGAGTTLSNMLLKQFNPLLTDDEIEQKSASLYRATKGERRLLLSLRGQAKATEAGLTVHTDGSVSQSDWYSHFTSRESRGVVIGRFWCGGTESHFFNKLDEISTSSRPRTPVLNCLISRALQKENVSNKYITSRNNWVVQSSGVDYLHLLLVATKWLMCHYSVRGRLCISIHDEVRYLVREEDRYKMTFVLQVANLWTRAMFAYQLGMRDLPMSVAFFSAVDIDTVLRKEVIMDCKTPSNPLGLKQTYGIKFGESIDIVQTIEKLNGNI